MKLILLCSGQSNHKALANKLAEKFDVCGIVIENKPVKKKNARQYLESLLDSTIFVQIKESWQGMLSRYNELYPHYPTNNILRVTSINNKDTIEFIKKASIDILVVSGTSIIKAEILGLPVEKGIVNLHTGLSPYIKGGPNCTNWCLATNQFEMIGNTIMWIDKGIDTGDIIATERTNLEGITSLTSLHITVMEHAHELYCRAIKKIADSPELVHKVSQTSLAQGVTYYSHDWNWQQKLALLANFKNFIKGKSNVSASYQTLPETVSL